MGFGHSNADRFKYLSDEELLELSKVSKQPTDVTFHLMRFLESGLTIIPLIYGTKKAATNWKSYINNKPTVDELKTWFSAGQFNWAVICGSVSGNLVVLDFEDAEQAELICGKEILQQTLVIQSGRRKGLHVYFRVNYEQKTRRIHTSKLELDIQGEGTYVVVAPSIYENHENRYTVINWADPLCVDFDIEEWVISRAEKLIKGFESEKVREEIDVEELLDGVSEGNRNNAAIKIATFLRRMGKSFDEAMQIIEDWNQRNKPPAGGDDWKQIVRTVEQAYTVKTPYSYRFKQKPEGLKEKEFFSEEDYRKAREILSKPNIYDSILYATRNIVGEENNRITLFLLNLIRQSVEVSGDSASGKNTLVDGVLECFPKESWLKVTGTSAKVLRYIEKVGTLYFAERAAYKGRGEEEETVTEYDMKVAISEGKLVTYVTEKKDGKLGYSRKETIIENFISTTTEVSSSDELENRIWSINTNISEEQTLNVMDSFLNEMSKPPSMRVNTENEKRVMRAAVSLIWNESPEIVVIPYAPLLIKLMPLTTRARRDIKKLVEAIKASARLHYMNRTIAEDNGVKFLIASPADLFLTWDYIKEAVVGTVTGMTKRYREMFEAAKRVIVRDEELSAKTFMEETGVSQRRAYKWLNKFVDDGKLVKTQNLQGRGYVYMLSGADDENATQETITYREVLEETLKWCRQYGFNDFKDVAAEELKDRKITVYLPFKSAKALTVIAESSKTVDFDQIFGN